MCLCLIDSDDSVREKNFGTNRELAKDSILGPVISQLERIQAMPDNEKKEALVKLESTAPDRAKSWLAGFSERNINTINIGLRGLIISLSHEGAESVRMAAALKATSMLVKIYPTMSSFSLNR